MLGRSLRRRHRFAGQVGFLAAHLGLHPARMEGQAGSVPRVERGGLERRVGRRLADPVEPAAVAVHGADAAHARGQHRQHTALARTPGLDQRQQQRQRQRQAAGGNGEASSCPAVYDSFHARTRSRSRSRKS